MTSDSDKKAARIHLNNEKRKKSPNIQVAGHCGVALRPKVCWMCNKESRGGRNLDNHHPNYSDRNKVFQLCRACHKRIHVILIAHGVVL